MGGERRVRGGEGERSVGGGCKDSEQTAQLSRRSTMGCESEGKKDRREEREKEIGLLRKGQCMEVSFKKKKKMPED